ncbi:NACHT, LRR and PYD domains-containing protein 3 [Entomortierella beljakovae]|nr:NACHT, LRR and PYD domains-containing protein 3 [Entomortierella beljakovae]
MATSPKSLSDSLPHSVVQEQHVQVSSILLPNDTNNDQVDQYKDDLALHTQMQLQLYLQDLQEQEDAQAVDAALAASIQFDYVQDHTQSNPTSPFATGIPSSLGSNINSVDMVAQSFQQGMLSLESSSIAAANNTPQTFSLGMNINLMHDGLALEHGESLHDLQEEMDDDDDEECLPPSETKYILYDDHVSPVSVREALTILNGSMYDELVKGVTLNENHNHLYPSHNHSSYEFDDKSPIYSPISSSKLTANVALSAEDAYDEDDEYDTDYSLHLEDTGDRSFQDKRRLIDAAVKPMGLISPGPELTKSNLSEIEERIEESLQGRSSHHHSGPDILLNLAGNVISPITVHEIFFSRYYSRLVYLNLWDTDLGIWGAQAVGGLMADSACRIQYLNLGCNRLGFEGIVQLAGLYKNSSLVELDLRENRLGHKAVHSLKQTMVRLAKDKACNIRRLNLSNNKINDVGCISIAKILLNTQVSHLDLSFNSISDWGASTILEAFESKELPLKDINLEANPLSFAGGVNICKILALPLSHISHLDLRGAKVTDVGVPYLAEALKSHHCPIIFLNLYDCQLTDTGILKLAIKLSVNTSLRSLGLGSNCIGDMGILALSQGLRLNSHLEELDIGENDLDLSRASLEALISSMQSNTSLIYLNLDIDGHPHAVSRDPNDTGDLFRQFGIQPESGYLDSLSSHQSQHFQEQYGGDYLNQQSGALVGEVLAPTHAAIAQPLQIPLQATHGNNLIQSLDHTPLQHTFLQGGAIGGVGGGGGGGEGGGGGGVVGGGAAGHVNTQRDREQKLQALTKLKTYVRLNFRRTTKLHSLCFEILMTARVLMFAKDSTVFKAPFASEIGPISRTMDQAKSQTIIESSQGVPSAIIPIQTGLPTPPLLNDAEPNLVLNDGTKEDDIENGVSSDIYLDQIVVTSPRARGTLACLPWEVKEMILRSLDRKGLLSEKQFQAIMAYSGSLWETTREPWERWGEIRETILEQVHCYYYEEL